MQGGEISTYSELDQLGFSYISENKKCELIFSVIHPYIIKGVLKGRFDAKSVQQGLILFKNFLGEIRILGYHQALFAIFDVSELKDLSPIAQKKGVWSLIQFVSGQELGFCAFIQPNRLLRSLIAIVQKITPGGTNFSFHNNEAAAKIRVMEEFSKASEDNVITHEELSLFDPIWLKKDFINIEGVYLPIRTEPHWSLSTPKGKFQCNVFLLNHSIVFYKAKGIMSPQDAKWIENIYFEAWKASGKEQISLLFDFSEVGPITLKVRKALHEWDANTHHFTEKVYFVLTPLIKRMYKIYLKINSRIGERTKICDHWTDALKVILFNKKNEGLHAKSMLNPELLLSKANLDLSRFSRKELEQLVNDILQERDEEKERHKIEQEAAIKMLTSISWQEELSLEIEQSQIEFSPLLSAIDILKHDVVEMMAELKSLNHSLEERVSSRTKKLLKNELNLKSVINNTDDFIISLNAELKVDTVNTAFIKYAKAKYGIPIMPGEPLFPDSSLDHLKELKEKWKKFIDRGLSGEKFSLIESSEFRDKESFYKMSVDPVSDINGNISGITIFIKDVTELKLAELELKEKNRVLHKLNQELDTFISGSAHDLRAPLASLSGLLTILEGTKEEEEKEAYIGLMKKSIDKMDIFIQDVMNYALNARLVLLPVSVDFEELIKNILESLQFMQSDNIKIEYEIHQTGEFKTDAKRLEMILNNLISNAFQYFDPGKSDSFVKISIHANDTEAVISIKDNGIGILSEYQEIIFDMFFRATNQGKGTGLGLFIVKNCVEKLDGRILLESKPGEGSLFEVKLKNMTRA